MHYVLNENEDVYQGRDYTPLSPTLVPFIYANRFTGAGKTLYHLYNATGHTFEGEVLRVSASLRDAHVVELLTGQELPFANGKVSLYLGRDDVACVAILPTVLKVGPAQGQPPNGPFTFPVQIKDGKGGTLVAVNDKAESVFTVEVSGGAATLDNARLSGTIGLKLLRSGQLVDAVAFVPMVPF
jgi:hypothetical protein